MTSIRDRDAGRDFEGNGPSSFDERDYREAVESMDLSPRIPGAEQAVAGAVAQIERAFGAGNPHHAKWAEFYAERARKAVAA